MKSLVIAVIIGAVAVSLSVFGMAWAGIEDTTLKAIIISLVIAATLVVFGVFKIFGVSWVKDAAMAMITGVAFLCAMLLATGLNLLANIAYSAIVAVILFIIKRWTARPKRPTTKWGKKRDARKTIQQMRELVARIDSAESHTELHHLRRQIIDLASRHLEVNSIQQLKQTTLSYINSREFSLKREREHSG